MDKINGEKKHYNWMNYVNNFEPVEVEIILDDIEFAWNKKDLKFIAKLWRRGVPFKDICKAVKRDGDEVFLALLHLARKRKIKLRDNYIWGNR